ncbi:MAG: hypothetical protein KAJ75_09945 [Alphaproteobacteria bacterium]|nr:hypothetical protein [Alphaproteobacteria bacterium]
MANSEFSKEVGRVIFPEVEEKTRNILMEIASTYEWTFGLYGTSAKSVLWTSESGQKARFKLLCKIFSHHDKWHGNVSINDFGCAYGALFDFLKKKRIMRNSRYHGYDICHRTLKEAQKQFHNDTRTEFTLSPKATKTADYSIASGAFGLKLDTDNEVWKAYVQETLKKLAAKTRKGLAFNILSYHSKKKKDSLYYADPDEYMAFCKKELSSNVSLVHHFIKHEWTILVRF